jgi:hypothetical protein
MCAEFSVCSLYPGGTVMWSTTLAVAVDTGGTAVIGKELFGKRILVRRYLSGDKRARMEEATVRGPSVGTQPKMTSTLPLLRVKDLACVYGEFTIYNGFSLISLTPNRRKDPYF